MKLKFVYTLSVILISSIVSCTSITNEEQLKKENDSLKEQLKLAETEINSLKESAQNFHNDYSLSVNYDDPQDVAKAFIKALNEENFGAAKELGTKNTAKMFGIIESIADLAEDDDDVTVDNPEEITWGETSIEGNHAVCYYSTPDNPNQSIDLKKIDGKWKVDIKKEN